MILAGLPADAGIGLRAPHYRELIERHPALGFVEVHSENFFGEGGQPQHFLRLAAERYAISLHGVGLGLGSTDPLKFAHLDKLKRLIERIEPVAVSEHVCWGAISGRHLNDLLPLPYTEEALNHFCDRLDQAQTYLGRPLMIENVSSYLNFRHSTMPEWEFVNELVRRCGCGLLLDINNVYVNAVNHGFNPNTYLDAIDPAPVAEIHLAGFDASGDCLIDTHGTPVARPVWALYDHFIECHGPRPTLIEWDTDLPSLDVLLEHAQRARRTLIQKVRRIRSC